MENADDGQFWSKCEPTRTAIAFEGILCFFNDCCSGANTYGTKLQYFIGFADVGDNVFFYITKPLFSSGVNTGGKKLQYSIGSADGMSAKPRPSM